MAQHTPIYDDLIRSKKLTPNEKVVLFVLLSWNKDVLWGKISSIYPNQNTLSDQCGMSRTTINRVINSLRDKKLIKTSLQVDRASLVYELSSKVVVSDLNKVVAETDRVVSDIHNGCIKSKQGVVSDMHSSSTIYKDYKELDKKETKKKDKPLATTPFIREVLDYLNIKLGTKYLAKSKKNQSLINARIKEGYTVEDFKTVIDKKYNEWHADDEMAKFLRPETLFGNKFESYLNQLEKKEIDLGIWGANHGK